MSAPESLATNFLRRWSRRKRAAERQAPQAGPNSNPPAPSESTAPPFDPVVLPPIESIGAASDIRAFLAPNVPIELRRAALRQLWVSDPAIRDFIGIAENQWDFTKPDSVPGFGSLELTPELRRLAEEYFGSLNAKSADLPPTTTQNAVEESEAQSEIESNRDASALPDKRSDKVTS
jgi:hypothetical protein